MLISKKNLVELIFTLEKKNTFKVLEILFSYLNNKLSSIKPLNHDKVRIYFNGLSKNKMKVY